MYITAILLPYKIAVSMQKIIYFLIYYMDDAYAGTIKGSYMYKSFAHLTITTSCQYYLGLILSLMSKAGA